jgi:hypothetical protein
MQMKKPSSKATTDAMQVESVVPPPLAAPTNGPMLTGTVASGRTVELPTGERVFRCFNAHGEALYRPIIKQFRPGQEVTLPEGEFCRLQQLGFIEIPGMVVRTEAEAVQLLGAAIVPLNNKDAADDQRARVDNRGARAGT